MKRLVADTGPILHLHEAGALHLIPLVGKVLLPPPVVVELRAHSPSLWPGSFPEWVKLQAPSSENQQRALQWQSAGFLHGGEAESLALALEIKPDWFLTDDAAALVERIRRWTRLPIAVGFGISTSEHVAQVGRFADAVVIGSAIVELIERSAPGAAPGAVARFIKGLHLNEEALAR